MAFKKANIFTDSSKTNGIYPNTVYSAVFKDDMSSSLSADLNSKQASLVSGVNIKTINGDSILGSGNITVAGGVSLLDVYPVGAVYISVSNIDPGTLFGGTWEQIQDTFLLSAGSIYTAGDTGGEATHTLTIDEMPAHKHTVQFADAASYADYPPLGTSNYNNTRSKDTSTVGGGQAHNNMPPYLVVYMWQRIS